MLHDLTKGDGYAALKRAAEEKKDRDKVELYQQKPKEEELLKFWI